MGALIGKAQDELAALLAGYGEPAFRSRQLAEWIYRKRARSFDEMTNLPQALRQRLTEGHAVRSMTPEAERTSGDGATKHTMRLGDDRVIECVHLPYPERVSVCLSSQVGCPVGCAFCATGLGGFERNLTAGEMVEQFLWMQDLHSNRRISHAVFMGMGEPLLNVANVIKAANILRSEVQVSARNLTISTVGIVPGIYELAAARLPVGLAISLHAPDDAVRSALIPTARRWPISEILSAARHYRSETGRDVTYEYILLSGVNDTVDHARRLADLLHGERGSVNLIPYNPVAGLSSFSTSSAEQVAAFRGELQRRGLAVTQRMRRGRGAAGACGQLAGRTTGRRSTRMPGAARRA